ELGRLARAQELVDVALRLARALAVVVEAGEIPHRGIEPHVEELGAAGARNLEAEVGRIARDVPVAEPLLARLAEPFLQLVARLGLQVLRALRPSAQELLAARVGQTEEVVLG